MKKIIEVAVGVIVNQKKEILLSLRGGHQILSDYWEFPGGKLERGETCYQALCRELLEEIGIRVIEAWPLSELYHEYPNYSVKLYPWVIKQYSSEPMGKEGQRIMWKNLQDIYAVKLLPANYAIIEDVKTKIQTL